MAEAKKQEKEYFFRSDASGLTVLLGGDDQVRFDPYIMVDPNGAEVKVGYFRTKNTEHAEAVRSVTGVVVEELEDEKDWDRHMKHATRTVFPVG